VPADTYELFRLTLIERYQADLFSTDIPSREKYIQDTFSKRIEFDHYTMPYSYIPVSSELGTRIVVGKIGRAIKVPENSSPEEGFEEQLRDSWKAAVVAIDPGSGVDGQKVAMLREQKLGRTFSVLKSLVKELNIDISSPYTFEVMPIFSSQSFWEFAKQNKGSITSLTFDFVVPNGIWNTDSHIKEDLRSVREAMNAEEVITTFKSEKGIITDSPQVEEAMAYIDKGSGSAAAKTRDGKTFDSTTKSKRAIVEYERSASPRTALARALRSLAKILDHE